MLRVKNSRSKTLKTCPRSGKQLRTEVWWPAMLWPKTTPSASRHVNLQIIGIGLIKYKEGQVCHVGRREVETAPLCLCFPTSSCPGAQPPLPGDDEMGQILFGSLSTCHTALWEVYLGIFHPQLKLNCSFSGGKKRQALTQRTWLSGKRPSVVRRSQALLWDNSELN